MVVGALNGSGKGEADLSSAMMIADGAAACLPFSETLNDIAEAPYGARYACSMHCLRRRSTGVGGERDRRRGVRRGGRKHQGNTGAN